MKILECEKYEMSKELRYREHESVLMVHNIENGDMYEINEEGKVIFYELTKGTSIKEIINKLVAEYDEERERIEEEVSIFLTRFVELGIIDLL